MARSGRSISRSGSSSGKRTVRRAVRKPASKAAVRKPAVAARAKGAIRPGVVDRIRPTLIPKTWRIQYFPPRKPALGISFLAAIHPATHTLVLCSTIERR